MVFSSLAFICVFLPVVFLLHQAIPSIKGKNALLIVASLVFYSFGEPVYVLLMIASTLMNWAFGLAIGKRIRPLEGSHGGKGELSRPRAFLVWAVVLNLAMLAVFKYTGMIIETAQALTGLDLSTVTVGIPAGREGTLAYHLFADANFEVSLAAIALPIGISFYTFQAMSYVVDVYRGEVEAQRSYAKVLLYISFFPQLVAGPIVKYHDVEAQLAERHVGMAGIAAGLRRFCIGLGKKVLIANTMAVAVDSIFAAQLDHINIAVAWIAAIAYLMQIYFDFSGYSDMAIGMARMFGFRYKENFAYPYSSTSIKVFWRRWHISLSTWFKEYLYIPLGGNRKGRGRAVVNKLIVFFLCGLWHGASWTFVVWGLIHGLFLLLEEYLPIHKLPRPLGWLYCMLVVTVAFVLFRAESFQQGWVIISQMFTGFHFEYACTELAARQLTPLFVVTLAAGLIGALPVKGFIQTRLASAPEQVVAAVEVASYVFAFVVLFACLLALSGGGYNPFIYFRF